MVHVIFSNQALLNCNVVLNDKDTLLIMYPCDVSLVRNSINKDVEIYSIDKDEELIQAFFNKITQKDLQIRSWY